jgi:hypothetical protein
VFDKPDTANFYGEEMNHKEIAKWARLKKLSYELETQTPFGGPGLKQISDGRFIMTIGDSSSQLSEFLELLYDLRIVAPDNLPDESFEMPEAFDERTITQQQSAELMTYIVRMDRFVDGVLIKYVNNKWLMKLARVLYSKHLLQENGWPKAFPVIDDEAVREGLHMISLNGTYEGRTTGSRSKCSAKGCPGWFIGILWESGDQTYLCSEGWHYDPENQELQIIGGGEITGRFVTPREILPRSEWPSREALLKSKGWRINP